MKLETGNRNLVETTYRYAGDKLRTSEGGDFYSKQEVINEINAADEELQAYAERNNLGWNRVISYDDAVVDQIWYTAPSTLDFQIVTLELEPDGKNLSSDTTASPIKLHRGQFEREWILYQQGRLGTEKSYWLIRYNGTTLEYGILPPPSTAGTKSIRLVYETEHTEMVDEGDEPFTPTSHHKLLCLIAAEALRTSVDMDTLDTRALMARLYPEYVHDMGDGSWSEPGFQPQCVGLSQQQYFHTRHGFARRQVGRKPENENG